MKQTELIAAKSTLAVEVHCVVSWQPWQSFAAYQLLVCPLPMLSTGRVVLQGELSRLPKNTVPADLRIVLPPGNPGGAVGLVLERSRQVCLSLYQKPLFTETMYLDYCTQCQLSLNPEQMAVFAGRHLSQLQHMVCQGYSCLPTVGLGG